MTISITKWRLALAIVSLALVIPATAYATHVFNDVPDTAFYAEPVEWAADNGITTGKTPTQFAPLDNVTRGESVTFLQRYENNVVAPMRPFVTSTPFEPLSGWTGEAVSGGVEIEAGLGGFVVVDYVANIGRGLDETGTGVVDVGAQLFIDDDPIGAASFVTVDHTIGDGDPTPDNHLLVAHAVAEVGPGTVTIAVTNAHDGGAGDEVDILNDTLTVLIVPTGDLDLTPLATPTEPLLATKVPVDG